MIVSYPLLSTNVFLAGHDWPFSFMRIEGMSNCILGDQFPVRISGYMFNDYGELSGIFYPNLFIYIPVFFRFYDIPWAISYNIFCVLINIFTAFLSYWSFSKLFNSVRQGAIAAMIYTAFFYRLIDLYSRSAIGETLAIAFLPLTFIGLWFTLHRSNRYWSAVVIGFTGILQSHILSSLMVLIASFIIIIFSFRSFIENLKSFAKIAFFTTLLNLWFYLPFLDFYSQISFLMKVSSANEGPHVLSNSVFDSSLFLHLQSLCGFVPIFIIVIFIALLYKNRFNHHRNFYADRMFWSILIIGIVFTAIPFSRTLCHVIEAIPFLGNHSGVMQFAFRFMIFGALALSYCLTVALNQFSKCFKRSILFLIIVPTFIALSNIASLYNNPNFFWSIKPLHSDSLIELMEDYYNLKFDTNFLQHKYFKFGYYDYIYSDIKPGDICDVDEANWFEWNKYLKKESKIPFDDIQPNDFITNFKKIGVTINFTANTNENKTFLLPLFYYPGYKAYTSEGEELKISSGINHRIKVEVPKGETNVTVRYVEPLHWKMANILSITGFFAFIFQIYRERRRQTFD